MAVDLANLSKCMGRFKNAEPRVYESFVRFLDEYVTELTVAVTEAPQSDVLVSQGRAQIARKFMKLFTEIPQ